MPPVIEHPHERFERHGELADALPSIFLAFGFAYAFGMFLTGGLIFLISKYGGSSMTNAFYITLVTVEDIELGEYDEVASAFVKAFYNVTSEHLTLTEFTKPHLSDPRCEVEYTVEAIAVLQANAPRPWTLEKNKMTNLLRNELPFAFKLSKRAVDKAELAAVLQDAEASSSMIASISSCE